MKRLLLATIFALASFSASALESAAEMPVGHFVRIYDKAHLTAHPDQLVKEVELKLKRSLTQYFVRDFSLRMKLRGRKKLLKLKAPVRARDQV